jgi:hypothetical protein
MNQSSYPSTVRDVLKGRGVRPAHRINGGATAKESIGPREFARGRLDQVVERPALHRLDGGVGGGVQELIELTMSWPEKRRFFRVHRWIYNSREQQRLSAEPGGI